MFDKKTEYSLVLAGGGARGAYEIGAWKALKELKIEVNAVAGTSVGALNAAIIAQDEYELGIKLWTEMTLERIIRVPEGMLKNGKLKFSFKAFNRISDLNLDIRNLGLDTAPLYRMLKETIREDDIRKSGRDLGIVTVEVNSLSSKEIFLDAMEPGTLPDYLLASASIPAVFKNAEINGKKYADGGIWDNIPHRMMKHRGYKKIIVVDISGLGVNRRPDIAGTDTIYIKNSMDLGGILDFDPNSAERNINIGYLDTLKVFDKVKGINYFFKPDRHLEENLTRKLFDMENVQKYSHLLDYETKKISEKNIEILIRNTLPPEQKFHKDLIYCLIDAAAASLDIERNRLYTFKELIETIKAKYAEIKQSVSKPTDGESESFFTKIGNAISLFITEREKEKFTPYEYALVLNNFKTPGNLFPEYIPAEIFLSLI